MKKTGITLIIVLCAMFVTTSPIFAVAGVGIGTGKIQVDEELNKGALYDLPAITVINTGDETSLYELTIEYHEGQPELTPSREWFEFSPENFTLEAGATQVVTVNLNLPLQMTPGDYFAYIEAHPVKPSESGGTSVGIAAAAKLYFTVKPSSQFEAIYHRLISLWNKYQPWTTLAAVTVALVSLFFISKKYLKVSVSVGGKKTPPTVPDPVKPPVVPPVTITPVEIKPENNELMKTVDPGTVLPELPDKVGSQQPINATPTETSTPLVSEPDISPDIKPVVLLPETPQTPAEMPREETTDGSQPTVQPPVQMNTEAEPVKNMTEDNNVSEPQTLEPLPTDQQENKSVS